MNYEVQEILAVEDEIGEVSEIVTDLALLETADIHEKAGCDCDFCIGYQLGLKAQSLREKFYEQRTE